MSTLPLTKINFVKKIILTLVTSIYLLVSSFALFPSPSLAQDSGGTWYNQGFTDWYSKVYGNDSPPSEIFGERYTAAQVQWIIWGLLSQPLNFLGRENQELIACVIKFTGENQIDLSSCVKGLKTHLEKVLDFVRTIQVVAQNQEPKSLTAMVFDFENRPMSGIGYFTSKLSSFRLIPEASAQGFGYKTLNPIQKYWSGFRNIAYSLVVIAVIIFAFMIMFRVKINPQTVISVQSALPKVIGAVILATFSYAIAGLMIDFMYVVGGVFVLLLKAAGFVSTTETAYRWIFPTDNYGFYILAYMVVYLIVFVVALLLATVASAVSIMRIVPAALFGILTLILAVWVLVLCLWYTFKIPWVLIKNLISVYVSIITAPIQIVLGTFAPSIGFGQWLKKLITELLVFPVTGMFMYFAWALLLSSYKYTILVFLQDNIISQLISKILLLSGADTSLFQSIWVPPIIGYAEVLSPFLMLLASFSIIIALPKVIDILKSLIMGEKFAFGTAVGEAFGAAKFAYGATIGQPVSMYQQSLAFESISKFLEKKSVHDLLTRIPIIGSKAEEVRDLFRERAKRGGH